MKALKLYLYIINAAERAGACYKALLWLREYPRTIAELVAYNREWAKWAAIDHPSLPDEYREALDAAGCGRSWWRGGKRHREDGPAIEYANGSREWWVDGQLHRYDGPAAEYRNGTRTWWVKGKLHRDDGPAVEYFDGGCQWWIEGVRQPEPWEEEK